VGSEIEWRGAWERIGRPHGDVACFSFHARKLITTGEGGMVTTADAEIDRRLRSWRSHGVTVAPEARHASPSVVFESYAELGFNYRMSDVQAAIGREQLRRLPLLVARRRELAAAYAALLTGSSFVMAPREPSSARSNWQSYGVRLAAGFDQRDVMQRMLDLGIATRRGVTCAHREAAFPPGTWRCGAAPRRHAEQATMDCATTPGACRHLVESERAQDQSILLPLFPDLADDDPSRVVAALESACR
jgi:dTDP-4-amino-4,6-dideoxygalactose transaminase